MLKTIKSFITSILLAGTIMYGAAITPELHNKYLRWEVGQSVVQVLHPTQFGGGTGFAVKAKSGKEYIMTNKHVCGVQVNGYVRIKTKDAELKRKVVYEDKVHDLCLIEGVKGLDALSIGSDLSKGDSVYVVGHPGLRSLTVEQGEYIGRASIDLPVEAATREQCTGKIVEVPPLYQIFLGIEFLCFRSYEASEVTAVVYGGNSGSPVVNKFGNLVAVVFAGNTEQEHNNFLVPLRYVKSVLNKF